MTHDQPSSTCAGVLVLREFGECLKVARWRRLNYEQVDTQKLTMGTLNSIQEIVFLKSFL